MKHTTNLFWFRHLLSPGAAAFKRRRKELQLVFNERRFRSLVENSNDAIAILSKDVDFIYMSPSVINVLGYTVEEIMQLDAISLVHPEDVGKVRQAMEICLANPGVPGKGLVVRVLHKNKSWQWIETTLTNMLHDRAIRGIVDNFRNVTDAMQDIAERKKNETAIIKLNEELNRRAEELAASNSELEQFAYVASHDLQEPLRVVSSFLQLLENKYQSSLDETARQYIQFSVEGAARMKSLILDLLEYSRVNTSQEQRVSTNITEIINQVLDTFVCKIKLSNAIIKVSPMPVARVNNLQMTQLFQNLIGNAFKYNRSAQPQIEIGFEEKCNHWQFFVKDNGIGIDPKSYERIFIIFQRLHTRNQFSGTGIGLAICKKIVEKHEGKIWVHSTPGQGSTFYFTIKK